MVKALGQSAFFLDRSVAFVVMAAAFIYVKGYFYYINFFTFATIAVVTFYGLPK